MTITLEGLKKDIVKLNEKDFFEEYLLSDDNWYFENVLSVPSNQISQMSKKFNSIIANEFMVSTSDVIMVGSAKMGYSLVPPSNDSRESKLFKAFCIDGVERKASDIDIAIISESLFNTYWKLLRDSFKVEYSAYYKYIPRAIYRGYINEFNLQNIQGCRRKWNSASIPSKKKLQTTFFTRHSINYRIYRNWHDLEDYHVQAFNKIKRGV